MGHICLLSIQRQSFVPWDKYPLSLAPFPLLPLYSVFVSYFLSSLPLGQRNLLAEKLVSKVLTIPTQGTNDKPRKKKKKKTSLKSSLLTPWVAWGHLQECGWGITDRSTCDTKPAASQKSHPSIGNSSQKLCLESLHNLQAGQPKALRPTNCLLPMKSRGGAWEIWNILRFLNLRVISASWVLSASF